MKDEPLRPDMFAGTWSKRCWKLSETGSWRSGCLDEPIDFTFKPTRLNTPLKAPILCRYDTLPIVARPRTFPMAGCGDLT
jgi:hypothetical protein